MKCVGGLLKIQYKYIKLSFLYKILPNFYVESQLSFAAMLLLFFVFCFFKKYIACPIEVYVNQHF